MPIVRFEPAALAVSCSPGESLFEIGRRAGIAINTACVAKGTCGLCRLKVLAGEGELSPLNAVEKKHLGNVYFITKERLSCQTRVGHGDVTVLVPPKR